MRDQGQKTIRSTTFKYTLKKYVMFEAPAGSQGLVNCVSYLVNINEGLGLLKLVNIVLNLIKPSPCYVND